MKSLKLKWHACQDDWRLGSEPHTVLLLLVIIPVPKVTGQTGALRWCEITCPSSTHSAVTWHIEDISEDISITYNPPRLKIGLMSCQHIGGCAKICIPWYKNGKNEQYLKAGPVQIQRSKVTLHPEEVHERDEIDFLLTSAICPTGVLGGGALTNSRVTHVCQRPGRFKQDWHLGLMAVGRPVRLRLFSICVRLGGVFREVCPWHPIWFGKSWCLIGTKVHHCGLLQTLIDPNI